MDHVKVIERAVLGLLLTLVLGATHAPVERKLPAAARSTIDKVSRAAKRADFATLRGLMVKEFTWSFGGDADVDQAISAWKEDPRYLKELGRVLRGKCRFLQLHKRVECPGDGTLGFRAGFVEDDGSWRMEYFVEGD